MEIDRLSPTRRPHQPAIGYQRWRSLLFMHWTVPLAVLRAVVPEEFELDLYEGRAFVGVVPFVMKDIRPFWCPEPLAFNFLETNVRTYVLHNGRPGVYFFSLEANSRIAVQVARRCWGLPYYNAKMSIHQANDVTEYTTQRLDGSARHVVQYQLGPRLGQSVPGSLEHFLLERYLLFVKRSGKIAVGQVHHSPYPAQLATVLKLEDQLVAAAGLLVVDSLPEFVHYAAGVDVEIFPLRVTSASQ